ncbi:MAG: WD40 repeat domain-containing serine/threonine protein kinase [Thermomicrobiales bacterium]
MTDGEHPDTASLLLARYHVEGPLGEGAFGTVVRAFDTRLKRFVAIKTLKHSLADTDLDQMRILMDRFTREAEAGSRMGVHPNLVAVYDLAEDAARNQHLILEYVPGGTLASRLDHGPLPLAAALSLLAEVSMGLQAAHNEGIVHRDVKPANVFFAADGRAKVGDFGIAQIDQLSARTHAAISHPGTLLYMSPEQSVTSGYLHPTSDQYSVGLLFFEALTGVAYKRLLGREAEERLAAFPADARALFRRTTAPQPDDRYPRIADVAAVAQEMARQLPEASFRRTAGTPPGIAVLSGPEAGNDRWGMPQQTYQPQPIGPSFGGYSLPGAPRALVGHTSWVLSIAFSPGGETLASASVDQTVRLWDVRDGVAHAVLGGHADWVSGVLFSPDGETLHTASHDDSIRLWRVRDSAPLGTLVAASRGVTALARSPDGTLLASGSRDRTVRVWHTSDGIPLGTLAGHAGAINTVTFSPDGALLASGSHDRTIRLWRASDGIPRQILVGHLREVTGVAFAPDGEMIASASDDQTVRVWQVKDGAAIGVLTGPTNGVRCIAFSPDGQIIAAGSDDRSIRLWRASDGYPLATLAGHTKGVRCIAFAPDGQTLASGSSDGTIRLWALGSLLPAAS